MNRRHFLKSSSVLTAAALVVPMVLFADSKPKTIHVKFVHSETRFRFKYPDLLYKKFSPTTSRPAGSPFVRLATQR